jgi:tRNA-dihydrouridine synthase
MVGQAAIGRPRLMTGHEPSIEERHALIVRHARMIIILYHYYHQGRERGRAWVQPTYDRLCHQINTFDISLHSSETSNPEKTMVEYRKYLFNYISGLPGSRDVKTQLAQTKDYGEIIKIISNYLLKCQ